MTPDDKALVEKAKQILERELARTVLDTETTIRDLLQLKLSTSTSEQFGVVLLDLDGRVIEIKTLFHGGLTEVQVDLRVLAAYVLSSASNKILIWHNHPSLRSTFSDKDIELTNKIRDALSIFGVELLDHYLVTNKITALSSHYEWPATK